MTLTECLTWLEKICADMREQDVDIAQTHMSLDEGVGPTLSHCDELELLSFNLRIAIDELTP